MARFEPALKCAILCPKLEYPYVLHFKGLPLLRALDQNLTDAYHDPQFKLAMVGATIGVAMSLVECLGLHLLDMSWIHNSNPFFWGLWKYVCKCKYVVSTQLRGIYQIFRHIFSIIQYSPLKCIQIANRWTYSHRQNYGKK